MKQLLFLLLLSPIISYGQIISSSQIGVNSQTQFAPDGQHIGAFMYIAPDDTTPVIGYRTKEGYTYQLTAPFLINDFTGTAVCQEYVDSIVLSIPSLHIGAIVPGTKPNTIAYFDVKQRLSSDPDLSYITNRPGSSILSLNSDQGFTTTGAYQSSDADGNVVFFGGEFKGAGDCYLQDASGSNYTGMFVSHDGTDVEFDMFTDAGDFILQVDPNSGGALFSSSVESNSSFHVLDGSAESTATVGDGFITSQTNDRKYSTFIETSSDGSTNEVGISNPAGTVVLQESPTGSTWNMILPKFPTDAQAGVAGLIRGDLFQDPSGMVHVKQ